MPLDSVKKLDDTCMDIRNFVTLIFIYEYLGRNILKFSFLLT